MNDAIDNTSSGPKSRMRLLTLTAMSLVMALFVVSPARAGGNSLNAKACQKGGWTNLVSTTGATFANEDACVAYGAHGGVLKRGQTISFTSANPSPVTVGGTYTPTASATSGLPVTITVDPTSSSVCTQSSAVVTFNAAGTCTINANQAGNATYNPATQVQQSITVINPVNPSQAACESYGGTFGTATSLWTCTAIPDTATDFYAALQNRCLADGGVGTQAVHTLSGQWDDRCFAADTQVEPITVNPSQATCESVGGTFGTATPLWRCNAIPDASGQPFYTPLQSQCLADGGVGAGAVHWPAGPWDVWCFASAVDVLVWITGLAVAAVLAVVIPTLP